MFQTFSVANQLIFVCGIFFRVSLKYVSKKKGEIALRSPADEEGLSILETMLRSEGGEQFAIILAIDLLFGGVDSVRRLNNI